MPFISPGKTLVSKDPCDLQLEIVSKVGNIYVPIKTLRATKKIASNPEHSGGSALASNITQGAIDYEGEFGIGTWVTASEEDAEAWEELLYLYLVKPWDEGRSQYFNINQHQREWSEPDGKFVGGKIYRSYQMCKLTGDSFDQGESGTVKTTYPWQGLRRTLGYGGQERGGSFNQASSEYASSPASPLATQ
jgi:hypothetical protein